jgi:hypothetical protein
MQIFSTILLFIAYGNKIFMLMVLEVYIFYDLNWLFSFQAYHSTIGKQWETSFYFIEHSHQIPKTLGFLFLQIHFHVQITYCKREWLRNIYA